MTITPVDDRGRDVPLTHAQAAGAVAELLTKQDPLQQGYRDAGRALDHAIGAASTARAILTKAAK